ncbi:hypothetical protein IHQ68_00760 [Chelatococcus sambhunathii]|uniref:Uncharacterized protein n=1 Tax=Chelatococcus sambhunathii TaxID=363953 RepID=A0ABU1DAL2_9HYPH|nr:hypothetical protein [Chelatococcus sambhunathii]MDR4305159.1 hypothetical protein [Chelatococcus sambhunathii]
MALTRRLLLGSAGVAALGAAIYGGSRAACSFVPRNHPDFFSLLDIVPDDAAARRLGRLAIEAGLAPDGLSALGEKLAEGPLVRAAIAEPCPTTRAELLRDGCAADFAQNRFVTLDGWVLSETEATLCAAKLLAGAA